MTKPVSKMSGPERVSLGLDQAGAIGLTQGDYLAPNVRDGGKPITRLARVINDLRNRGEAIEVVGKRGKFVVYVRAQFGRPAGPGPRAVSKKPLLIDGWLQVYGCVRCLGIVAHPSQACGETDMAVMSPIHGNPVTGCRLDQVRAMRAAEEERHAA